MTDPLVSILIPCFNAERFIGAALDSVLAQTYAPIEVIVVDDGSTDGSAGVLEYYRALGVSVIRQANAGQSAAANRALADAKGRYVKFFDADDLLAPGMIERQVRALAGREDAIAMGEWDRFYSSPAEATFPARTMYRDARPVDWLVQEWATGQPMTQCAVFLIPRAIFDGKAGWDERLSLNNDFEFFARVLTAARRLIFTPGARLFYRSGLPGSLSRRKSRSAIESAFLSLLLGTRHLLAAENSARTRHACAVLLRGFEFDTYPAHPNLRRTVRRRLAELGGANAVPSGPPAFHVLRQWVGWRAARRIQRLAERLGLNSASRRPQNSG